MLYKAPMAVSCINISLHTSIWGIRFVYRNAWRQRIKDPKTVGFQLQNKYIHGKKHHCDTFLIRLDGGLMTVFWDWPVGLSVRAVDLAVSVRSVSVSVYSSSSSSSSSSSDSSSSSSSSDSSSFTPFWRNNDK